jgi:hypothetical protein
LRSYLLTSLLYQLLTGHPSFAGGTTYETIKLLLGTEPKQPRQINSKIDRDLTVQTNPAGLSFTVDGTTYTVAHRFSWVPGSNHTIATTSPQSGGTGVQYVWTKWSDHGAISHTVAPAANATYTATFSMQHFLTMTAGTGGRVSPASGWKNSGATISISATPANGYSFSGWTGTGSGSYSGTNNPCCSHNERTNHGDRYFHSQLNQRGTLIDWAMPLSLQDKIE